MMRTEVTSIQVRPSEEQEHINLMQRFHWEWIDSRHVRDHVQLQFSRFLTAPELQKIRQLEERYFSLQEPRYPIAIWKVIGAAIGVVISLCLVLWLVAEMVVSSWEAKLARTHLEEGSSAVMALINNPEPLVSFAKFCLESYSALLILFSPVFVIPLAIYYFRSYRPRKRRAVNIALENQKARQQILEELAQYG